MAVTAVKAVCRYPNRVYGRNFNSYSQPYLFYYVYIVTLTRTATISYAKNRYFSLVYSKLTGIKELQKVQRY
jgi:hypothetical protein